MKLNKIEIISIPVSDQDGAKAFYCEVLGFKELHDEPMDGDDRWIQLGIPGAETSISLVSWFEAMPPGGAQGMVLDTPDIDAAHAELRGIGLDISDIEDAPWGRYAMFFDPDGNGWVLQQAAR